MYDEESSWGETENAEDEGGNMGRDERQKGKSETRIKISKMMRTKGGFLWRYYSATRVES